MHLMARLLAQNVLNFLPIFNCPNRATVFNGVQIPLIVEFALYEKSEKNIQSLVMLNSIKVPPKLVDNSQVHYIATTYR